MINKIYKYFSNQLGQHLIEYTTILILVMAGILVMGPYVIRSWNAHLKGWEDSTRDSVTDPMTPGDPGDIVVPGCVLFWQDGACGPVGTGAFQSPCNLQQRSTVVQSTPLDCHKYLPFPLDPPFNPPWICTDDPTCCEETPLLCADGDLLNNPPGQPECPMGTRQISILCGNNPAPQYRCDADATCIPTCDDQFNIRSKDGVDGPGEVEFCVPPREAERDDINLSFITKTKAVFDCTATDWTDKCQYRCVRQGPPNFEVPMGFNTYGGVPDQGTHATRCSTCLPNQVWNYDAPADPRFCPANNCHEAINIGVNCATLPLGRCQNASGGVEPCADLAAAPGFVGWCYRYP
jgi:hypothetical protein